MDRGTQDAALVPQRTLVQPTRAAGLDRPEIDEHPVVGPDVLLEPHGVVDGWSTAPDDRLVLLTEARAEIREIGERGPVHQRVVPERCGGTDPEAVGEHSLQEVGRRHRAHIEQRVPPALGDVLGCRHVAPGRVVEDPALALCVKGRDHGEDHLAVLNGDDVAGRERAPVPVTVHLEDDGQVAPPRPQEVAVERVGKAVGLHGGRRGEQTLRRHLPAVEGLAWSVVGVATAEEVTVDPLEGQQGREVFGAVEVHHPRRRPHPLRPRLDAPPEELARPGEVVHVSHSRADEEVHAPGRLVRPRLPSRIHQHIAFAQAHEDGAADRRRLGQRPAGREAPHGDRRRHGGRCPRRQVATPGGEVPEVAPHDVGIDVVVVEAPGHGIGTRSRRTGRSRPARGHW